MQSVIMKKNDKGQTVVQISYEKVKQTDGKSFVEPRLNRMNTLKSMKPKRRRQFVVVVDIEQSCGQSHKKG